MRKEFCCHPRDQTEMENNINEFEFISKKAFVALQSQWPRLRLTRFMEPFKERKLTL